MKFSIYEDNLARLEKKIATIQKKCKTYGYYFHYQVLGEEFRDFKVSLEDPYSEMYTLRYVIIDVEGIVKHQDWEFVAVINHKAAGNIIRAMKTDIEIPEKYLHTSPVCEHCNTNRRRKDTYLIFNSVTGEFKQVGKSCLQEFTNGMNAEFVAAYISWFDSLIQGEAPSSTANFERYEKTEDLLMYAIETVKHFGYQSSRDYEYGNAGKTTRTRCLDYYSVSTGRTKWMTDQEIQKYTEEMELVHFDADANKDIAEDAIKWALAQDTSSNTYLNNLYVICSSEYVASKDFGILISLASVYLKHLGKLAEKQRKESAHTKEMKYSQFVGNLGDKVTVDVDSYECVWSGENIYGLSFMYKFIDAAANIYMWSTSTAIKDNCKIQIKGTVKKHEEYQGVKQTWLTRCRVNYLEEIRDCKVD